jgi:hypothetical protein
MKIPLVPSKQVICSGECPFFNGNLSINRPDDVVELILSIARLATYFAVPIAVVVVVYIGIMTIFGVVKTPLAMLLNVAIGLGLAILGVTIIAFYSDLLKSGINLNIF